jgi:hypothetical protein
MNPVPRKAWEELAGNNKQRKMPDSGKQSKPGFA